MILETYGLSIFTVMKMAFSVFEHWCIFFIWHKWNKSLKMKHLKKGKIYYQWNHESIYVMNFVNLKNDFDDLNLKWVLSKSWSWFLGITWDFLWWSFWLFKRRFVEMIHRILDSWIDPSFVYEMVEIFVPLNSFPSPFDF